ncbi:LytTR family transcriptional regulator [Sporolactobacillus sp. THM7-7]|nr:LytTR family transcriptional regulator [Sporolactobacillus sp. THM7-7]
MKLRVNVDPETKEEIVSIHVKKMSEKVEQICRIVEADEPKNFITVAKDGRSYILPLDRVSHLIAEGGKNYAVSGKEKFYFRETLKYFEKQADSQPLFIRISKYCLANIEWMDYFEAGFSGNLILRFKNGWKESVSRKYVKNLKEKLY